MASEEPAKRWNVPLFLACLALGVASAAALLAVLAGVGSRIGWWHFRTGFTLLGYCVYAGGGAALLGVAATALAWRKRQTAGIVLAVLALLSGLTVAAVPVSWRLKAGQLPRIHDISTDTVNPPEFVAILPLRKDAPNPAVYAGPVIADQQKRAYPDLRTEVLDIPFARAFERAHAAARQAGWQIVAADPATGRIEAVDTTFWFGFSDDIVIRLAQAGERTLVDVRSVSRVGKSDVGTNAKRIRSYLKQLRAQQ